MIPIEQQVTSLETSLRLKELGVPQGKSYFVWFENVVLTRDSVVDKSSILCDAFTLSEIQYFLRNMKECSSIFSIVNLNIRYLSNILIHKIEFFSIDPRDLKL